MAWMWLIVLVLIVAAIVVKVRRSSHIFIIRQNPVNRPENSPLRRALTPDNRSGEVEHMVSCEYCEVYVPVSEVVERSGKFFCCREHSVAYFSHRHTS